MKLLKQKSTLAAILLAVGVVALAASTAASSESRTIQMGRRLHATGAVPGPAPPPMRAPCQRRSDLKYDCSIQVKSKVIVHWSNGEAHPPSNPCTGSTSHAQVTDPGDKILHMAIETPATAQWSSLAFAEKAGSMEPADAVIGWLGPDGTSGKIGTYYIKEDDVKPDDQVEKWAFNTGIVREGSRMILCFSRRVAVGLPPPHVNDSMHAAPDSSHGRHLLQAGGLYVSPNLNLTAATKFNFAYGKLSNDFLDRQDQHTAAGGFKIDMLNGGSSGASSETEDWASKHGILMAVAFALLMPIASLAARHKGLYEDTMLGPKKAWFVVHASGQACATIFLIAGISIAFVKFKFDEDLRLGDGVGKAHRVMGILVLSLVSFQVVGAQIRPDPDHKWRFLFNAVHRTTGFTTLLLSWATLWTGVWLYNDFFGEADEYHAWIGCLVAAMALTVIADLVLTVLRLRRGAAAAQPGKPGGTELTSAINPNSTSEASNEANTKG